MPEADAICCCELYALSASNTHPKPMASLALFNEISAKLEVALAGPVHVYAKLCCGNRAAELCHLDAAS